MLKASRWPDWMDELWAKSAEKGEGNRPETLAQHTWYVLERLTDFIQLRPELPQQLGAPRLWHILYWAAFLHDFGKAASGFQARLRGGERWPHRHEVFSLAFLDWLEGDWSDEERKWLIAAIASHHRDASVIAEKYDDASILFADIAGYTKRAGDPAPADLVRFLDRLYTDLDALVD
ncbi:MAG TPA: CRISPR-associated endonuclease Cas3'', partial [Caldilineaceae bacterium]|nr:CRISPR-associated endonuclease Cas3'' [Caldilineaceae bacterium]